MLGFSRPSGHHRGPGGGAADVAEDQRGAHLGVLTNHRGVSRRTRRCSRGRALRKVNRRGRGGGGRRQSRELRVTPVEGVRGRTVRERRGSPPRARDTSLARAREDQYRRDRARERGEAGEGASRDRGSRVSPRANARAHDPFLYYDRGGKKWERGRCGAPQTGASRTSNKRPGRAGREGRSTVEGLGAYAVVSRAVRMAGATSSRSILFLSSVV